MARSPHNGNKQVCPKLTKEKKEDLHRKRVALAANITDTKKVYAQATIDIAHKHGR
jgi:hypothetical protein